MLQPHLPEQLIIPLLIQEKLSSVTKSRVCLAVFIGVGCCAPGPGFAVQEEGVAFADVEEEADGGVASA